MFAFAVKKTKRGLHCKNCSRVCLWVVAPKTQLLASTMQAIEEQAAQDLCLRCIKCIKHLQPMMDVKSASFVLSSNAALQF
jgi:hypothetical protein